MADRNIYEIAEFLQEAVKRIDLSPEQAGKKAKIDRGTVENLLANNSKKGPFYLTVEALSKGLGYDLSYVLRKEDSIRVDMDEEEFERYRKYKMLSPKSQIIMNEVLDRFYENEINSIKK